MCNHLSHIDLVRPDWTLATDRVEKAIWLDKNENIDPRLASIISKAVRDLPPQSFYGYPDLSYTYHKLANFLDVDPSNLLLSYGSDGAIRSVFEAFISLGDKILVTNPTFVMYELYAKMYGASLSSVEYQASESGPVLNLETILNALESCHYKLLCLPNPDSPTGTAFDAKSLYTIINTCASRDTLVLIDEAYYPFCSTTVVDLVNEFPQLVIVRSFAKAWAMAGLRIGYAVGSNNVIKKLHKVRPMYEVSTISAMTLNTVLDFSEEVTYSVNRILASKNYFHAEMVRLGFSVCPGNSNFILVNFGHRLKKIKTNLAGKVLFKASFDHFALNGFSRISVAPMEIMSQVTKLISEVS